MALDIINGKINALRTEASQIRATHTHFRDAVRADSRLTLEGKREQILPEKTRANERIAALHEQEVKLITEKIESLEKSLFPATISSSDIIAERDAQDRADNIKDETEAIRLIERSHRSGDRSLTNAILRRSLDAGWGAAINTVGEKHPASSGAVDDIHALSNALHDVRQVIDRGMAYGSITD